MAGETSKRIGDFGEVFLEKFFNHFNWVQLADANLDVDCIYEKHKTPKGRERKTHGIDYVFCYDNPYDDTVKEVFIVEGKSVSWGKAATRNRRIPIPTRTLSGKLKGYLETLQEKIVCAKPSQLFRETYDLVQKNVNLRGLIFYHIRDEFYTDETRMEVFSKVKTSSDESDTSISIFSNNLLIEFGSIFNYLNLKSSEFTHQVDYMTIALDRKSIQHPWTNYITLEMIYSSFIVARVNKSEDHYEHYIFYRGVYTQDGIKRFLATLSRVGVFALSPITLCPLNATDPIKDSAAFRQYFSNNTLHTDKVKVEVKVDVVPRVEPQMGLA